MNRRPFSVSGHGPEDKPGVSNLLTVLAACSGRPVESLTHETYGALKREAAEAVVETLRPIQERYRELSADPAELSRLLDAGAARAVERGAGVMAAAREAIGLP
ncbi:tryptophanyl-tRNA synthetase [Streptosporangium album]|uniref:Tryptophanyl-tRNA synthetase n=1 Tax=Streptosporangium album TaxID=47479 RepID=A0A7W7RZK2_9ACTN|nr:hypothetical protein [Streptosporangium album]MBB4941118.1 tryptophanyl-tRNA synthetase [Streptosporangium album]